MVYEPGVVGCQISQGKHGRMNRDKHFSRGESMPVAICCGQDPLLYLLASSPLAEGVSKYEWTGASRGRPVPVVRGPYTGLPVPATAEIVLEGDLVPDDVRDEGPFGEWMGYYFGQPVPRAVVHVRSVLHRDDPILCCAPQHRPIDETALIRYVPGAAQLWEHLRAAGIPDVRRRLAARVRLRLALRGDQSASARTTPVTRARYYTSLRAARPSPTTASARSSSTTTSTRRTSIR